MPDTLTSSPKPPPGSASPHRRPHPSSGPERDVLGVPRINGGRSESVGVMGSGYGAFGGPLEARSAGNTNIFAAALRSATPTFTPVTHSTVSTEATVQTLEELTEQYNKEMKIKEGAENLLQVLDTRKEKKDGKTARDKAERELNASNFRLAQIKSKMDVLKKPKQEAMTLRNQNRFRGSPLETSPTIALESPIDGASENGVSTLSLSEILQCLEEKDKSPEYYVQQANSLVVLFRKHQALKYDLSWPAFGPRVQFMLLHTSKEVVAAGYRMARYALNDTTSLRSLKKLNIDLLIIRSLARDSKSSIEREQALKLIRAFLDIKGGVDELSKGVIRALVTVAEAESDRLRAVSLETLAELVILDPEIVVAAGGMKVLTEVLRDGPFDLADVLLPAFLYLLDMPTTRKYIRAGLDLEGVFSIFTDARTLPDEILRSAAKIVSGILKSWPGLLYLSTYDFRAVKCLVECLSIPTAGVRDTIIELFFDIFRIKPPSWSSTFLAGRRLTTYGRVQNMKNESTPTKKKYDPVDQGNLVEHYNALLLSVFFEAGMLEALMAIVQEGAEPAMVRKTTLLLGEILKLASRLLPNTFSAKKQLLPALFNSAAKLGTLERFSASAAVYQIDSLNRTFHRSMQTSSPTTQRTSLDEQKKAPLVVQSAGARQVDQVRMAMNMAIDDSHFRNLIVETGVLTTKNFLRWNWDVLTELIQGPLMNPKRLEEAFKATKFMKRILSFYRPFKGKFCAIINTKPNQRYVRVGCSLFYTLLQTPEGVKYLSENKVLRQIAECLAQLDRMSGITSAEPVFSRARLSDTLSSGYFTMLGILSSDPNGLAMMERWRMFNMFYHLSDLSDREDLIMAFLGAMDFTLEGHPRIIFAKCLTSGPKEVRMFATNHLHSLIQSTLPVSSSVGPSQKDTETAQWAIRLLITQLYDPDVEVCETAVKILEEACNVRERLEYVVRCRPALDHLGEIGAPLLLRFLSTSIGYHYLNELDYIEREMDDWFHGRNDSYVLTVEASLARAFADDEPVSNKVDVTFDPDMMGLLPPHFYRELARTAEGCRLLKEKGHFEQFSWFVKEHALECEDPEIITKLKGCLWAVGNIGCMQFGSPFLDEADIVETVIKIAQSSEVWTVKGTAYFVLGLISRTMTGLEILAQNGWDVTTTPMGESLGFCVPTNLKSILNAEPWDAMYARFVGAPPFLPSDFEDPIESRILAKVGDLSGMENTESQYVKDFARLKQQYPSYFNTVEVFQRVILLLESFRYRTNVRRLILDSFDKSCIEKIVLHDPTRAELGSPDTLLSPSDSTVTINPMSPALS